MEAPTMGQRTNVDEPIVELVAAVIRQAAWDYQYAVKWLASHPRVHNGKEYKNVVALRNSVIRFVHSDLYDFAIGDAVEPEQFLKMALKGQIKMTLR